MQPLPLLQTRDGRKVVRIYGTPPGSIRVQVHISGLNWEPRTYPVSGIWNEDGSESGEDLIELSTEGTVK